MSTERRIVELSPSTAWMLMIWSVVFALFLSSITDAIHENTAVIQAQHDCSGSAK